jgi:isopenicillin N synthase-like dioxygenase
MNEWKIQKLFAQLNSFFSLTKKKKKTLLHYQTLSKDRISSARKHDNFSHSTQVTVKVHIWLVNK